MRWELVLRKLGTQHVRGTFPLIPAKENASCESTKVNVLKFRILIACQNDLDKECRPRSACFFRRGLDKQCKPRSDCIFRRGLDKQCRPRSCCFCRSSLIWVFLFAILTSILWIHTLITNILFENRKRNVFGI